ncbi:MAG: DUF4386 domain-containing protein [candidate division Zixibacteria bacterium]|nr:DUF4386 domain-containing protein [candidate division Zixibacteria bacterium]
MINRIDDISQRALARIAGFGYLIIIVAGIFAEFFVRSALIVPGDATATANNIMISGGLYRIGIAGDLVMLVCDAIVAWALYVLLKPINKNLALLAAIFRLLHATINGINLLNMLFPLFILSGAGYFAGFTVEQLHALVMLFLDAHAYGYVIALAFFGIHCLILGYLILKSQYLPKGLGLLMIAASLGYLIDSFAHILMSNYADYAMIFLPVVAIPAIIAELSFCLWLLFVGIKNRPV